CGLVVGRLSGDVEISNVTGLGDVQSTFGPLGGIVGMHRADDTHGKLSLDDVAFSGDVIGFYHDAMGAGGIIGFSNNFLIERASYQGNVSGVMFVGGILGAGWYEREDGEPAHSGVIKNSVSRGSVTSYLKFVGGIVGDLVQSGSAYLWYIKDSYSTSLVHGYESIGGLAGYMRGVAIRTSYFNGMLGSEWQMPAGVANFENQLASTRSTFYNSDKNPGLIEGPPINIAKTDQELRSLETFTEAYWDIGAPGSSHNWTFEVGTYPQLSWEFE
ncbi:MAG: hypothetical protein KDD42_05535, partial [Bdellovibrionales bacterium]|nr:hypothetical protein [Bdellovibrionales bacterium]